jgi:hypothetical protein
MRRVLFIGVAIIDDYYGLYRIVKFNIQCPRITCVFDGIIPPVPSGMITRRLNLPPPVCTAHIGTDLYDLVDVFDFPARLHMHIHSIYAIVSFLQHVFIIRIHMRCCVSFVNYF